MNKRHKHADLIHAWADGTEIQFLDVDAWCDCYNNHPGWDEDTQYRIKPSKPQKLMYRVALLKNGETGTADNEDEAMSYISYNTFNRWLTDWIEYDIDQQPEQWPSNLIERIAKIDLDAATWLRDNWNCIDKYRINVDSPESKITIHSLMCWRDTPQGHDYWRLISNKLGE